MNQDDIFEAYYKGVNRMTGAHPLVEMLKHLTKLSGIQEKGVDVQRVLHESLSPDYLRDQAVDIIKEVLLAGGLVYIWTVGDDGEYYDSETGITHPAHNFQRRKIEASSLQERLVEELGGGEETRRAVEENLHLRISSENKYNALDKIVNEVEGITSRIYVVDDQMKNIEEVQDRYPDRLHKDIQVFHLNNDHPDGNLTAFAKYMDGELRSSRNESGVPVLIIDWDDTLWDEQARIHDFGETILRALA